MAKRERKEPWNSKIQETQEFRTFYDEQEGTDETMERSTKNQMKSNPNKKKKTGSGSTVFLTFLVAIMFAIIGAAIIFTIWNSRTPDMETVTSKFYTSGDSTASSASSATSSTDSSSSTGESSSSSSAAAGNTYTVVGGDYPNLIAEKTGVAWEEIVTLNPTLDPNNAGYYKDGSQLTAGQTLIISK